MSAPSHTFWLVISALIATALLVIWLAAGLLAAIVVAAAGDLVLSVAERRHRLNTSAAEVSDR